ncbi:hypothetical protein GH714_013421 [Hevea brasiliensis]|uniref:EGF-like domain-containing protein n=1 Tax=Hevea brasiliensis TaxID=3981 RepID=A0A6A6NAS0_HEVBR|nr:hypothetical protein GH714_013421 [Hevea brasiliensis]
MEDAAETFGSGCVSLCGANMTLQGSCSDERTYNVSDLQLSYNPLSPASKGFVNSENVIEWVVREETCEAAQSSSNPNEYACGDNSNCLYSVNGQGYRCVCKDGFTGNPDLPQGCQDIDECKEPDKYKCDGTCKNTFGAYTCRCPLGMRGDGKVACRGFRVTTIAAENHTLHRILRFNVASENEMEEIEVCAELAKQCLRSSGIQRPTMKEVAEELGRLRKLNRSSWDHGQSSQETEHLLAESSYSNIEVGTSKMSQNEILRLRTFDIEHSTDNI